jgi:hypothetical protein
MKFLATISSLVPLTAAAADPQITPRAEVAPRQESDPARLGYVSASSICKHSAISFTSTATFCYLNHPNIRIQCD